MNDLAAAIVALAILFVAGNWLSKFIRSEPEANRKNENER